MFSKRYALLGLVVVGIAAVGVGAIATGSDDGAVRPPDASERAIEELESDAAASFGFLRKAQTPADRLPARVAADTRLPYGANVELSRRVAWGNGTQVFAVPGRGFMCTVVPSEHGSTGGCQTTAGLVEGTRSGPSLIHSATIDKVYAVVPDGVAEVELGLESGKALQVQVQNGGYYTEVPTVDPPRTVTYEGLNGTIVQQVPVPPDLPME